MNYAETIIRELLFEEVAQNSVVNAIKRRHEVSFKYDSRDGDRRGKLERITVQPVAIGTTKSGNPCFRAYQTNGSSESAEKGEGKIPGWRLFLLDRVVPNTWKDSGKVFNEPPMYNPNGDETMATVLMKADFTGASTRYERGGLKKYNKERHDKAVENNPFYDFEKQLKRKRMAPDYVLKNIKDTERTNAERGQQWNSAKAEANKGNEQSVSDMSKVKNFGNEGQYETNGPVKKGETDFSAPNTQNGLDYSQVKNNGPVYKNPADNDEEIDTEKNGTGELS